MISFKELQHLDFQIVSLIAAIIGGSANLYVFCNFGKLATDSYAKMAICLYESNWRLLPVELQKYIILMIINMQIPLRYHGFGVAVMDLETFTKVRLIKPHPMGNVVRFFSLK